MALAQLKALEDDMKKCFRCNQCKIVPLPVVKKADFSHGCPANLEYLFQGYSGGGKQIMALSLLNGRIEAGKRLAEITNACTTCGLCDVSCKFIMEAERNKVNMALREHMVETGFTLPEHDKAIQELQKYGHPDGEQIKSPGEWAKNLNLKILPQEKTDVLLFAGHETRSDPDLSCNGHAHGRMSDQPKRRFVGPRAPHRLRCTSRRLAPMRARLV